MKVISLNYAKGCLRSVSAANVLDCSIVVSEFERQSRYHGHFRTNTYRKDMKPLPPTPDIG